MSKSTPIILIDDDLDDHFFVQAALEQIAPDKTLITFADPQEAFAYLQQTTDQPFLIISEIHMQPINGIELRRQIEQDKDLRQRAIPFIFYTDPIQESLVDQAYELTIQGFFQKSSSMQGVTNDLQSIMQYWSACYHPNRFRSVD